MKTTKEEKLKWFKDLSQFHKDILCFENALQIGKVNTEKEIIKIYDKEHQVEITNLTDKMFVEQEINPNQSEIDALKEFIDCTQKILILNKDNQALIKTHGLTMLMMKNQEAIMIALIKLLEEKK